MPADFDIHFDKAAGVVLCRVDRPIGLPRLGAFATDLTAAMEAARQRGAVRLLWDGLSGCVISFEASMVAREIIGQDAHPGDRIAIVVPDPVAVRAAMASGEAVQIFGCLASALFWLRALPGER